MNCSVHPDVEAVLQCAACGDYFCEQCLVKLGEHNYCRKCIEEKISTRTQDHTKLAIPAERRSRLWTFLFSLIPGVGYLYLGLMNRGLQTMVLFFGSIFVSNFIGFEEVMALVVPVVIFYSIFDAQQLVKRLNTGAQIIDEPFFNWKVVPVTHNWLGYALIIIGGLALMHNTMPQIFPFWYSIKRALPPVMIILLGIAILYRNTRS